MMLERFPRDVQTAHPDVVVIQAGHNDANRWLTDMGLPRVSLAAFRANLKEMIVRCETFGALPVLCTLTPSFRSPAHESDCRIYEAALRDIAGRLEVRLADVRPAFSGPDVDGLYLDGLHLTAEGHRLYAAVVARALA
jgi:lysophospholipase L1-like esterase